MSLNVKDFGALGDGIQEDSSFLNAAIIKAVQTGTDLFLPSGTYKCETFLSYSKILRLDQSGTKKIKIFGETGTKITTSLPTGCILYIAHSCVDVVIDNIFFENTHDITLTQTNAIQLLGSGQNSIKNLTIRNCRFEGFSTAIVAQGVRGLNLYSNVFDSPKGHDNAQNTSAPAVHVWLFDNANGQCYDVKVINNYASGFSGTDITTTTTKRPMDGFVYGTAYGLLITDNTTRNFCEEHIAVSPQTMFPTLNYPVLISNNIFYLAVPTGSLKNNAPLISNYGIRADCNNVTISNNIFQDYSLGILIYPLFYPTLKQGGYTISNNRFQSTRNSSNLTLEAIKVQGSKTNTAYNIVISNNTFDIDSIQLKSSRSVLAVYDSENVVIQNNTIFSKNVTLNTFILTGITTTNCLTTTNQNNISNI